MSMVSRPLGAALAGLVLLGVAGCGTDAGAPVPPVSSATSPSQEEHPHKPGQHGGTIVSLGSDSYHAEAVFEKGGLLRLHMLGRDETRVQEVEVQELTAYVKTPGDPEAQAVALRADRAGDDSPGKTSRFLGRLPAGLAGKRVEVTIPSLRIGGERFRVAFESPGAGGDDHAMPAGVAVEEERRLYLTPGGKYTQADIDANGKQTASEKFRGFKAKHDFRPKPGDRLCPVTLTKANPTCTWVIGGKTYEFCCPPCVDEFVGLAKESPEEIHDPEFYRKK